MRRVTTFNQVSDFQREFESKARFLIDESVGMEVARWIRDRGWNVCYVDDVGLLGRSDEEVLAFAWKEQRILLTHDFDFLDDSRFPFNRNPGLVVLPRATDSRLGLADAIDGVLALIGPILRPIAAIRFALPKTVFGRSGVSTQRKASIKRFALNSARSRLTLRKKVRWSSLEQSSVQVIQSHLAKTNGASMDVASDMNSC